MVWIACVRNSIISARFECIIPGFAPPGPCLTGRPETVPLLPQRFPLLPSRPRSRPDSHRQVGATRQPRDLTAVLGSSTLSPRRARPDLTNPASNPPLRPTRAPDASARSLDQAHRALGPRPRFTFLRFVCVRGRAMHPAQATPPTTFPRADPPPYRDADATEAFGAESPVHHLHRRSLAVRAASRRPDGAPPRHVAGAQRQPPPRCSPTPL